MCFSTARKLLSSRFQTLRAHTVDLNQVESRVSSKWEFVTQMPHLPGSGKGRAQRHPSCHLTENSTCPGSIFHHIVKTSLLNAQLDLLGCLSQPRPVCPSHSSFKGVMACVHPACFVPTSAHWLCACVKPVALKCRPLLNKCWPDLLK